MSRILNKYRANVISATALSAVIAASACGVSVSAATAAPANQTVDQKITHCVAYSKNTGSMQRCIRLAARAALPWG